MFGSLTGGDIAILALVFVLAWIGEYVKCHKH
jgi:hypothetical protein